MLPVLCVRLPSVVHSKVESFEELETYQAACALDFEIFELTKGWPKEEMYSLTD